MPITALPTEVSEASHNFDEYSLLIYGREKIGKSTLFASFPDCLFLSTEPGLKGFNVFKLDIRTWKDMQEAAKLLAKGGHNFKRVVIDTVDLAYDYCMDFVCDSLSISYPGESASGENDWGKSWKLVKKEFVSVIHQIAKSGVGIAFTSHATESEIKTPTGEKYNRVYPSMSSQCRGVIEGLVDFFFYCEYVRDAQAQVQRVIITHGDETLWAGCREGAVDDFPPILPMLQRDGYQMLVEAFHGRHKGVDPSTLLTHRTTAKATGKILAKLKTEAINATRLPPQRPASSGKGLPPRVTSAPPQRMPPPRKSD